MAPMPRARATARGALQRVEIAVRPRRQNRNDGRIVGKDRQRCFVEAQEMIDAGLRGAFKLGDIGRVDAHLQAVDLERRDRLLEMIERRIRQTAEIDDVGAGRAASSRALTKYPRRSSSTRRRSRRKCACRSATDPAPRRRARDRREDRRSLPARAQRRRRNPPSARRDRRDSGPAR